MAEPEDRAAATTTISITMETLRLLYELKALLLTKPDAPKSLGEIVHRALIEYRRQQGGR